MKKHLENYCKQLSEDFCSVCSCGQKNNEDVKPNKEQMENNTETMIFYEPVL